MNDETSSLMASALASLVVNSGSTTSDGTSMERSPTGRVTSSRNASSTSAWSKLTPGLAGITRGLPASSLISASTGGAVAGHESGQLLGERLGPQLRDEFAVLGHQPQRGHELPRLEGDLGVAEPERHRPRHGRIGELRAGTLNVARVDVGSRLGQRELGGGVVLVEVGRHERVARAVGVELGADDRIGDLDALGLEPDRALHRFGTELVAEVGEVRRERVLVDVDHGGTSSPPVA